MTKRKNSPKKKPATEEPKASKTTMAPNATPTESGQPLTQQDFEEGMRRFADQVQVGQEVFGDLYDGYNVPWRPKPKYTADQIKDMNIDKVVKKLWEESLVPGYWEVFNCTQANPSGQTLQTKLILDRELGKVEQECSIGTASRARHLLTYPAWPEILAFFCALNPDLIEHLCRYNDPPDRPYEEAVMEHLRREDTPHEEPKPDAAIDTEGEQQQESSAEGIPDSDRVSATVAPEASAESEAEQPKLDSVNASNMDAMTLSVDQWAERFGVPKETLRKRLERLRRSDLNCYVEVEKAKSTEAKYLYRGKSVLPIIRDLQS